MGVGAARALICYRSVVNLIERVVADVDIGISHPELDTVAEACARALRAAGVVWRFDEHAAADPAYVAVRNCEVGDAVRCKGVPAGEAQREVAKDDVADVLEPDQCVGSVITNNLSETSLEIKN